MYLRRAWVAWRLLRSLALFLADEYRRGTLRENLRSIARARGLSMARELKNLFGERFDFDHVDRLLFNRAVLEKVRATTGPTSYKPLWQKDLEDFMARRAKYLLYD